MATGAALPMTDGRRAAGAVASGAAEAIEMEEERLIAAGARRCGSAGAAGSGWHPPSESTNSTAATAKTLKWTKSHNKKHSQSDMLLAKSYIAQRPRATHAIPRSALPPTRPILMQTAQSLVRKLQPRQASLGGSRAARRLGEPPQPGERTRKNATVQSPHPHQRKRKLKLSGRTRKP